jgi:hypothetical protein
LKKYAAKQADEEQGKQEEQAELNTREKDEGDLFGIRAIEAGFYAGIPQSRPTSRANSPSPSSVLGRISPGPNNMSSSTLIGGIGTPKYKSMASSVSTLPLAHVNDRNRDSGALPSDNMSAQRRFPPAIKLRPSEAELSGRINHNAAVNMSLVVPPSPTFGENRSSSRSSGSDSDEAETLTPQSAMFKPDQLSAVPPPTSVSNASRGQILSVEDGHKSHVASLKDASPSHSPIVSTPPSPRPTPEVRAPTRPERVHSGDALSVYTAYHRAQQSSRYILCRDSSLPYGSFNDANFFKVQEKSERPKSTVQPPETREPTHLRDASEDSELGISAYLARHERTMSTGSDSVYNFSFPEHSSRNSGLLAPKDEQTDRPSSLLVPEGSNDRNDPRFSEFYDAYFRQSHLITGQKSDTSKRPQQINTTQPTIEEVESPLPSPQPPQSNSRPGTAR